MFLSVEEAVRLSGYSDRQIRLLAKSGKVKAEKKRNIGKPGPATWQIDKASLEAYIQSQLK